MIVNGLLILLGGFLLLASLAVPLDNMRLFLVLAFSGLACASVGIWAEEHRKRDRR